MPHPIEFEAITKKFGSRTVLQDLTFDVPQGSVVGLLGPNGAGKSTAMRVLLGLQRANGGRVRLMGHEPGTSGYSAAVRRVGSIIEAPPLYKNATAMQNLQIRAAALGVGHDETAVRNMLDRVGLAERAEDKVGGFSLGMRQRVGLALAMIGEPGIIVLDEPTNGLDPAGAVEIRNIVRDLPSRGATALVCTHRLEEVEKSCDYVVVLRQGQLLTQGPIAEIIAAGGHHELTVDVHPDETGIALQALQALGLTGLRAEASGRIHVPSVLQDPATVTKALADVGVYLRGLETHHATLEEAFLRLTGEAAA
ncbi:ABC-2 type transport system ATP-binding protein [Jatrophihabitans sp. GAS493]|uniref:ABC transporter ATP-binding protein n=1 Tax=Jatrophihabitans sp. GAS493 TaxID=1907575 RepID=UPI000BB88B73|nr:ABC transporter ATP-binding protein [Jatrophihabitans sp. GAS493]SOD73401.1 ABC-2 type transport system ATP-binding protein [Jatrophihabitans sp. GAS493]